MYSDRDHSLRMFYLGSTILNLVNDRRDDSLKDFREAVGNRLNSLKQTDTVPPYSYLATNKNMDIIYRESILCYLLGIPNSSMPNIMRVLENSLKEKYAAIGKEPLEDMTLWKLINRLAKYHKTKELAHYYRVARNHIHESTPMELPDCVEAIRHISVAINRLYDQESKKFDTVCPSCNTTASKPLVPSRHYIGDSLPTKCSQCTKEFRWVIMIGFEV